MQQAYRHRDAWLVQLREHANDDAAHAYVWMAFNCAYATSTPDAIAGWLAVIPDWRDAPLMAFRTAICGGFDGPSLDALLERDHGSSR